MQSLAAHFRRKRERPHPKLVAKDLLDVLEPEHVVVIGWLLETAVARAGGLGAHTRVPHLLVFHHLDRGQVVVQLDNDAACQGDQCQRNRQ